MEVSVPTQHTVVGAIPKAWKCVTVGLLADLLTGFPFPSSGYAKSGIRLLRGSNVKRNAIDWGEGITAYWPAVTPDIRHYLLREDDIVIAMDGSLVGRSFASLSSNDVPALLLQRVARLRSSEVHQQYLAKWVCSNRFTAHCDAVKTTTAIPHISPSDIRSFQVAIPDTLEEQRAIAQALSDIDDLIQSSERLIAKKRGLKQAAMQQLLTGQTRLPGFSGEWRRSTIGEEFEVFLGKMLDSGGNTGTLKPYLGNKHVQWNRLVLEDVPMMRLTPSDMERFRLRHGDLLVCEGGDVGRAAIWRDEAGECYFQKALHRLRPRKGYDVRLMQALLSLWSSSGLFRNHTTQTSIAHLTREKLVLIPLPVPSPDEQAAIAEVLSDMDAEIDALEARLKKTRDLKQGMMQELLTGRTRLV